jgi:nucleoid-associated protein YgaU
MTIARNILRFALWFLVLRVPLSAQAGDTQGGVDTATAVETNREHTTPVPTSIANNEYLKEAWRLSNLARLAIQEGEYEASTEYAAEAVRYAALSDEYIKNFMRLLPALSEAADRLRWAENSGAAEYYPDELSTARADLQIAYAERRARNWDESYRYALLVIEDLAGVAAPPPKDAPPPADLPKSPNQYKVRPWDIFGDCFWNIAKWFYGDPWKWPLIYEANKDKLPEPDNPDWVEVGTILDLPSADGELREGYWDSGRPYTAP